MLQSMRFETSQKLAQDCRQQDLHCILYASAQHPHHSCVCLFKAGMDRTKKTTTFRLVAPVTENLLKPVIKAALGSRIPIIRD